MYLRETEYRPKPNQKKSDIMVKKSALEEKVKIAMERTKKAINKQNKMDLVDINE